jgi:hypothetical protein
MSKTAPTALIALDSIYSPGKTVTVDVNGHAVELTVQTERMTYAMMRQLSALGQAGEQGGAGSEAVFEYAEFMADLFCHLVTGWNLADPLCRETVDGIGLGVLSTLFGAVIGAVNGDDESEEGDGAGSGDGPNG